MKASCKASSAAAGIAQQALADPVQRASMGFDQTSEGDRVAAPGGVHPARFGFGGLRFGHAA
jgi:hypothetical protein